MEDINVVVMDLPYDVKGSVNPNKDGSYTIFVNAKLNCYQQHCTYLHELEHIKRGDFETGNVQELESSSHGIFQKGKIL